MTMSPLLVATYRLLRLNFVDLYDHEFRCSDCRKVVAVNTLRGRA